MVSCVCFENVVVGVVSWFVVNDIDSLGSIVWKIIIYCSGWCEFWLECFYY